MPEASEDGRADLRQQMAIDDQNIERAKQRQWIAMYYCLLLDAAIFTVFRLLPKMAIELDNKYIEIFLVLSGTAVMLFALKFLFETERSLESYRMRQANILDQLSEVIKNTVDPHRLRQYKSQDSFILGGFSLILVASWILLLVIILPVGPLLSLILLEFALTIWLAFNIACRSVSVAIRSRSMHQ